jgi:hypothetical protein
MNDSGAPLKYTRSGMEEAAFYRRHNWPPPRVPRAPSGAHLFKAVATVSRPVSLHASGHEGVANESPFLTRSRKARSASAGQAGCRLAAAAASGLRSVS